MTRFGSTAPPLPPQPQSTSGNLQKFKSSSENLCEATAMSLLTGINGGGDGGYKNGITDDNNKFDYQQHHHQQHQNYHNQQNRRRRKSNVLLDKIPARLVLYFLSWSGFLVSFMMRNDINFALAVMVPPKKLAAAALRTVANQTEVIARSLNSVGVLMECFFFLNFLDGKHNNKRYVRVVITSRIAHNLFILLLLCPVTSCGRCCDSATRHKIHIRLVTTGDRIMFTLHSGRC